MNSKSEKLGQYSLESKKTEIIELNNLLEDDEVCKVIVSGIHSGNLSIFTITDKRIIVLNKKIFSSEIIKYFYDIENVTKIVFDKGFVNLKLEITLDNDLLKITDIGSIYFDVIINSFDNEDIVKLSKKENDEILKAVNKEVKRKEFERIMASNPEISQEGKTRIVENKSKELSKRQQKKQYEKERLAQLKRDKIPYCPKCKSTSLTYTNKKLSVGRALTGQLLFGENGAILGGLSSKKGYVKCLNCGHKWKL